MPDVVDCRGLGCPEPVILARNAMKEASGKSVTVLVSSAVARENVSRAAAGMGWQATVEEVEDGFKLSLVKK